MEQTRYQWIDIAKGIGIILVVYGHAMRGLIKASIIDNQLFNYIDTFIYSFHMPLFFLLSGIFFEKSIKKNMPGKFLTVKCKTILYPYVIYSLLQTGVEALLSRYTNGGETLSSLYTCLFIPRAQYWFLFALFFINLLNTALYLYFKKIWLLISSVIGILYFLFPVNLSVFYGTFNFLIFFNLGILLSHIIFRKDFFNRLLKIKYFIAVFFLFILSEYFYVCKSFQATYFSLIAAVSGSLFIVYLSIYLSISSLIKLFVISGKYSLEIYIMHVLFSAGVRIILSNIFNIHNSLIHIMLGIMVGIFLPLSIMQLLKNWKWSGRLFRLP
ncbi:MAG: acyltransferase family protein [Prevotellaceae bacterium]|jgi:fucose 4-O-acetylase-like acetyltransferase|nr:acyltransferase family protein [Prevotellaceae bacterium]